MCPTGRQRGDSAVQTETAIAKSPIGRRVLVIGMPHTGTTSMHSMLLLLGCCYNTHNLNAASPNISWTWKWPPANRRSDGGYKCKTDPRDHGVGPPDVQCGAALIKELQHFQCVQDSPWAVHWRSITAAYPQAYVVLTRAQSALRHVLSGAHFGGKDPNTFPEREVVSAVRSLQEHLVAVRAEFRTSARYFEICLQCGDDAYTLARSLGLDPTRLQLPTVVRNVHNRTNESDVAFLRKYAWLDKELD